MSWKIVKTDKEIPEGCVTVTGGKKGELTSLGIEVFKSINNYPEGWCFAIKNMDKLVLEEEVPDEDKPLCKIPKRSGNEFCDECFWCKELERAKKTIKSDEWRQKFLK